jgi:pimeloyl-ACP methyl ester carboxylesterase
MMERSTGRREPDLKPTGTPGAIAISIHSGRPAGGASLLQAIYLLPGSVFSPDSTRFTEATAAHAVGAEGNTEQILALDPASLLSSVRSPTLVVHAEHDLIPLDFSRSLRRIQGASSWFSRVGHFSCQEDPVVQQPVVRSTRSESDRIER